MGRLRILFADSNRDIRESMRQVVEATGADVSLTFADDVRDAINLALTVRPHLAMLDVGLRMPVVLTVIRHFRRRLPEMRIILMITGDDKEYRRAAQEAGACAVISKESLNEDWMRAIICLLEDCKGAPGEGVSALMPKPEDCEVEESTSEYTFER